MVCRSVGGRGVACGPLGWLLGRWSAFSRLRCGAQPWGGGAELTALCCAKLRSDSRAEFDVEVRLAAHRPKACAPRHRPSRLPHSPPATPLEQQFLRFAVSQILASPLYIKPSMAGFGTIDSIQTLAFNNRSPSRTFGILKAGIPKPRFRMGFEFIKCRTHCGQDEKCCGFPPTRRPRRNPPTCRLVQWPCSFSCSQTLISDW